MTDDLYNKRPEEKHPVMEAMNYMGYDVMTLVTMSSTGESRR